MHRRGFLAAAGALVLAGCTRPAVRRSAAATTSGASPVPAAAPTSSAAPSSSPPPTPGTPSEILARSTVPVLCYHQLRDFRAEDDAYARTLITPEPVLRAQLGALRAGGYTPVPAGALVDHLQLGTALPARPVLLTFDDGSATHHSVALPVLTDLGFTATFFPMTVVLDKPDWLSEDQLRELDRAGMTIGAHTWDHPRLDRLAADQWDVQLVQPKARLAAILGHAVDLFAYPYGAWSQEALTRVDAAGYRAAFQLAGVQDTGRPLLTIRRITPPPSWDGTALLSHLAAHS
jgi:peptidoglycan/xylan/chitin deacetylase (PgdA/CDA1 family)